MITELTATPSIIPNEIHPSHLFLFVLVKEPHFLLWLECQRLGSGEDVHGGAVVGHHLIVSHGRLDLGIDI